MTSFLRSSSATSIQALYLDFDSFFASAEQHLRPELRGKPVGVVPMPSEHTCLIAASREAKKLGFKTGTPVREARAICPEIVIVDARPDAYVRLHHAILEVIGHILPIGSVRSIDELVCHLMQNEQMRAVELALEIKAALAEAFSSVLTCSIGLGPNELIAKIAAERDKPNGLVLIRQGDLPDALHELALSDVPGIARGNMARLARAGVADMRGLLALAPKQMRAIWGGVEGERMHVALHGGLVERPVTQRGMFGHSRILPRSWTSPGRLAACARLLLVKAARRMRREGYAARCLSLGIRLRDGGKWRAAESFEAVRDDPFLLGALQRLLRTAHQQGLLKQAKSISVTLHDVLPDSARENNLFTTQDMVKARERREKLSDVTDTLAARFGHSAAMLGLQRQPPGGYAGAKIAFRRIPDIADFG